jgi:imidazole glycerol-phosphate synthase subunit HisF
MEIIKIMPCLDMKEGRVVKGIHFVDLKDAGDPVENAAFYEKEGADELAMLDIAATVENRKTRLEWVKRVSSVIHIPLTVGGGISSLEDIELTLKSGASKISMNSAAVEIRGFRSMGEHRLTLQINIKRRTAGLSNWVNCSGSFVHCLM